MTTGKPPRPPRSASTAAFATRVAELVAGLDPSAQRLLADKHASRVRRPRSVKAMPAVLVSREPARYLRTTPTRSRVLNAFLYEVSELSLQVPPCHVLLDERALAPLLVEMSRKYLAPMAAAAGQVEVAFRLLSELPPVTNERGAEVVVRRALSAAGPLGAIARDYEQHRQRTGASSHDVLLSSAMLAAFAGRVVAQADKLLGVYVRDEVQTQVRRIVDSRAEPLRSEGVSRRPAVRTAAVIERAELDPKKRSAG